MVVHAVGGGVIGVAIAAAVGLGALLYFIYESSQSSNQQHSYGQSRRSPTTTRSPTAEAPRSAPANTTRRNNINSIRNGGANQPNSRSNSTQKPKSDINNIKPAKVASTDSMDNKCSICMEVLGKRVMTLPCFHSFHGRCILPWITSKESCPNCRQKI